MLRIKFCHAHRKLCPIDLEIFSKRNFSVRVPCHQNVLNVFDRNAKLIQKNRTSEMDNFAIYDYLKEEVGYRLADRIFDIKRKFSYAVDLGCGRGYVSRHILMDCIENLTMCDMSKEILDQASVPEEGVLVTKLVVNEEELPFQPNSLDLVLSSLSLHWVNDLPGTFKQVINCLKNDGAFLGALFGGDTLYELRSSLQLAESERLGGLSSHISPFTLVSDVGGLLSQAGFTLLTIDTDEIVINYPSMFELIWDLKGMGENNCTWNRCAHLNREVLLSSSAIYKELYGSDEKIPATFQIIYFLAWKPDISQPKPLERGTATHSLKDIGDIIKDIRKISKKPSQTE